MKKQNERNLQYTIQNLGDEVVIYIRTSLEEEFDFCTSFPVIDEDGKQQVSMAFVSKVIELANQGYKQIP